MLRFFFKKNFYDGWDNVIFIIIPNLIFTVFLLIGGGLLFLGAKLSDSISPEVGMVVWLVTILIILMIGSILVLAWAESAREIADYEAAEIKTFFKNIKSCIKDGIFYALLLFFVAVAFAIGIIYYFRLELVTRPNGIMYFRPSKTLNLPFVGLLTGCVFFWIMLTIFQGLFFYPALRASMHDSFKKAIKKCFIVFFDNIWQCFVLAIYNLFLFLISVVMLGLAPGIGGIGLARMNFLRLILKKYDYIEELKKQGNTNPFKYRVDWSEVLKEDIEITGTRSFKSFFMPWKE